MRDVEYDASSHLAMALKVLREASTSGGMHMLPEEATALLNELSRPQAPIPMRLTCPSCNALHIDVGEFATKVHHTHACQSCGMVWRPAVVPTVGVQFLPGFKNE